MVALCIYVELVIYILLWYTYTHWASCSYLLSWCFHPSECINDDLMITVSSYMVQFTEKKKNAYNYYFTDSCWHYYIAPHVLSDKLNWIIEMDSMSPFIISNKLLPRICCHISILDSFTLVSLNSRCYLSAMLMSLFFDKSK